MVQEPGCAHCGSVLGPGDDFCGNCGQPRAGTAAISPDFLVRAAGPPGSGYLDGTAGPLRRWADDRVSGAVPAAALGEAKPNTTYLGQRLLYEMKPEPTFDPLTNTRFLSELLRHALIYFVLWWIGLIVSAIFFSFIFLPLVGRVEAFGLWIIFMMIASPVLAALFWLLPVPALLSEWKFTVDGKALATSVAFEHIVWALRRHQTPLDSLRIRRLRLPGREARDYLELRRGFFAGFVGCFRYGQDLYVGWTFWLYLSPARWLLMLLARIWQRLTRRGTDLYVTLRYDSARAMREAMHSTAREGVDVATGQLLPQGTGHAGFGIPVNVTVIGS